jgi:hypothetical protein
MTLRSRYGTFTLLALGLVMMPGEAEAQRYEVSVPGERPYEGPTFSRRVVRRSPSSTPAPATASTRPVRRPVRYVVETAEPPAYTIDGYRMPETAVVEHRPHLAPRQPVIQQPIAQETTPVAAPFSSVFLPRLGSYGQMWTSTRDTVADYWNQAFQASAPQAQVSPQAQVPPQVPGPQMGDPAYFLRPEPYRYDHQLSPEQNFRRQVQRHQENQEFQQILQQRSQMVPERLPQNYGTFYGVPRTPADSGGAVNQDQLEGPSS